MSIFDLIVSTEIAAYWEELSQHEAPYVGEEIWPADKKRGLSLKWLKGSKGLPIVLKTSAFDAAAIARPRIAFEKLSTEMPYFKESKYVDEEMRQELNMVIETGNQNYIDAVVNNVFDDQIELIRGARATRERMRMMALTTGVIAMSANGQSFNYDYQLPEDHKGNAETVWSDVENSDPINDITVALDKVEADTGIRPTRAMCNSTVWKNLRQNKAIKNSIYVLTNGAVSRISDAQLKQYIEDETGLSVYKNDKQFIDENGVAEKFCPDNTFVMFPGTALGKTWFGTTPAESDLMTSKVANVAIVDTGVAITTVEHADPVNVETIVSMICLPDFPLADQVFILDTEATN